MIKIIPLFILTICLAYSCSSTSDKKKTSTSIKANSNDSTTSSGDDFSDFDDLKDVDFENGENNQPRSTASVAPTDDSSEIIYGDDFEDEDFDEDFSDEVSQEMADFDQFDDKESNTSRSTSSAILIGGEIGSLKVKKGETLMLIAFNLYGDYAKWKMIRNLNPGIDSSNLKAGQIIKYEVPKKEFIWAPAGKPYLIKEGDTLGTISTQKYGTSKKWRNIYENNRPMIKNPNLIFAGFTLYYIDGESDFAFNY